MREATIRYKTDKTLNILRELGKHLGFSITEQTGKKEKMSFINGVPVINGDDSIDISELHSIFTEQGLDAAELRNSAWQRKK